MEPIQLMPELLSDHVVPDHTEAGGYLFLDDDVTTADIVISNT